MSNPRRALVAYTIFRDDLLDDPRHAVYADAYGLEMCIDDEWPIDTVLLAQPELVDVITSETGVTSMGTVYAGSSAAPSTGDFASLKSTGTSIVLLDSTEAVLAAVSADLNVLLRIDPDAGLLKGLPDSAAGKLDIAVNLDTSFGPDAANSSLGSIRKALDMKGLDASRIVLATTIDSINETSIKSYTDQPNIDGVLLLDTSYVSVLGVLSVLAQT